MCKSLSIFSFILMFGSSSALVPLRVEAQSSSRQTRIELLTISQAGAGKTADKEPQDHRRSYILVVGKSYSHEFSQNAVIDLKTTNGNPSRVSVQQKNNVIMIKGISPGSATVTARGKFVSYAGKAAERLEEPFVFTIEHTVVEPKAAGPCGLDCPNYYDKFNSPDAAETSIPTRPEINLAGEWCPEGWWCQPGATNPAPRITISQSGSAITAYFPKEGRRYLGEIRGSIIKIQRFERGPDNNPFRNHILTFKGTLGSDGKAIKWFTHSQALNASAESSETWRRVSFPSPTSP